MSTVAARSCPVLHLTPKTELFRLEVLYWKPMKINVTAVDIQRLEICLYPSTDAEYTKTNEMCLTKATEICLKSEHSH
jgi:hypothetical protein